MYIRPTRTWYDNNGQHADRQWFLILVQPGRLVHSTIDNYDYHEAIKIDGSYPRPRAIVRKVALEQLGNFMMGYAKAFGHKITISGTYGADGLPRTVAQEVYDRAIPLPDELYDAWNNGGGWNSAGTEAPAMRRWALDNFDRLSPEGAKL